MRNMASSAFAGLLMAIKDPKVPLFAVLTCAQLLGLGFINFFPTYVSHIERYRQHPFQWRALIVDTRQDRRHVGILDYCHAPYRSVSGVSLFPTLRQHSHYISSPPWILAAAISLVNAWHAGQDYPVHATLHLPISLFSRPLWRTFLTPLCSVVERCHRIYHQCEHVLDTRTLRLDVPHGLRLCR